MKKNLNANPILFTIKNKSRSHVLVGSFAEVRSAKTNFYHFLYPIIKIQRDFSVQRWSDNEYAIHLRTLLNEHDWMQFKGDILQIYAVQNAKREALRKLVEFNSYRSLNAMYLIKLTQFLLYIPRCCHRDPLRDPTWLQQSLTTLLWLICMPLFYVIMFIVFLCLLLDTVTAPRFVVFYRRHVEFLESVMIAHPELDPAAVEEELVQKLRQLLESLSRNHPGVHCKLSSSVVHHKSDGNRAAHDVDVFEIQFLQFAPETEP